MMADGWLTLADGNTYYFSPDGHMASSETIDGHRVDDNGVLQENTEDLTGTIYDTMSYTYIYCIGSYSFIYY